MKNLVIFDFDGTLVDTIADAGICFNKALDFYGFKTYDLEDYGKVVGGNLETIFSKLLDKKNRTEENIKKLKDKYREIYLSYDKPNTKPFEGILELLLNLNEQGVMLAINTNKAQNLTESLCQKFFSEISFVDVIGYAEEKTCKPDPSGILEIIKKAKTTPENTLYVGDGKTDIETATESITTVAVSSRGKCPNADFTPKNSPSRIYSVTGAPVSTSVLVRKTIPF